MPLEVTPLPFADLQLPYTPKFVPEPVGGDGSQASIGHGPASAAASAIIPPVPGGIASPNRAIPALPHAGYTAPTLRPIGASIYGESHGPLYGPPGSVMAGGSLYEFGHSPRLPPPQALSVIQSDYTSPSSLPAPRRSPVKRLEGESVIAPKTRHELHHHHHSPNRAHDHGHRHSPSRYDDDDARSDASYYAMPKSGRRRSDSMSSQSEFSSPREPVHRRSGSLGPHHHPQIRAHMHQGSPSSSMSHSPVLPSPLSLEIGPAEGNERPRNHSPKSPASNLKHGYFVEEDRRSRRASSVIRDERPPYPRRHTSVAPESGRAKPPSPGGNGQSQQVHEVRQVHHHQTHHNDRALDKESLKEPDRSRVQGKKSQEGSDHTIRRVRRASDEEAPSAWDDAVMERQTRQHSRSNSHDDPPPHHIRHHSASHIPHPQAGSQYGASPTGPSPQYLRPDAIPRDPYRRRALSMEFGQKHVPPPPSMYQTPSVAGFAGVDAYDDGASIAGSAMTFMDGSVGGRTSQYGLPKYPHQPKPDYRRFCVQRGNADVFLD